MLIPSIGSSGFGMGSVGTSPISVIAVCRRKEAITWSGEQAHVVPVPRTAADRDHLHHWRFQEVLVL
jgi:hypothetical protein